MKRASISVTAIKNKNESTEKNDMVTIFIFKRFLFELKKLKK